MIQHFKEIILNSTHAKNLTESDKIQDLWSGYGSIKRFKLDGSERTSVVVKHVCLPKGSAHPRGWNTDLSHQRKVKSYEVETAWYKHYSQQCNAACYVPQCLACESYKDEVLIVMEDLNSSGYAGRRHSVTLSEIKTCLSWLAHFHAAFIGQSPKHLWPVGTYWHLETRPDELQVLKDQELKCAAQAIDQKLNNSPFQTFVHGDAKLANFCFSKDGAKVAAVDFQYVGGGCGMKDVAYFIGSCLGEKECERYEVELIDYYFKVLAEAVGTSKVDAKALENDWRQLYHVAWTDFHRFIKGWSPGHWKINDYSERLAREVINQL